MAGILQALGSGVTVMCRGQEILRTFDTMLRTELKREMAQAGVSFIHDAQVIF